VDKYAIIVGVHWFDVEDQGHDNGRIDLDLSALTIGQKIGWDVLR